MDNDIPTPAKGVYIYLDYIALGFVLAATEEWVRGNSWHVWGGCLVLGAVFLFLGVMGPRIKNWIAAHLPWARLKRELQAALSQIEELKKTQRPSFWQEHIEPFSKTAIAQPHGILGDFVDISFIEATYGSDVIQKPALGNLISMLASNDSMLPDGSISIGVGDKLTGGMDPHKDVYKYLKFVVSAKLHGGKALTISPGDRLLTIAQSSPAAGPLLEFLYSGVNRGEWSSETLKDPQLLYVKNSQVNTANKATHVTARVRFVHAEGTTFTLTEATWFWKKAEHRSNRSDVDIEGNEAQSFVLAFTSVEDEKLWVYKDLNRPVGICDTGKWTAHITLNSDTGILLEGTLSFVVYPDKHVEWGQVQSG